MIQIGDPTALYDTSAESLAHEAVDMLFFISIAFIYCEKKAMSKVETEMKREK